MKKELIIQFDPDSKGDRIRIGSEDGQAHPMEDLQIFIEAAAVVATIAKKQGTTDIDGKPLETWIHNELNRQLAHYHDKSLGIVKKPN